MTDSEPTEDRGEQEQVKWYDRLRGQMAIVGISIVVFLLVVGFALDLYIAPTKPAHRKDVAQALGLITAGAAGAVGIFFTWRAQRLAREAQEDNQSSTQEQLRLSRRSQEQNQQSTQAQLKNAQEELRLTRQGQMTERFTQAIEQLGSDKLEIKLGGIYSLERTAQEEKNYHWPVMEVLTSYVRRHAARKPDEESRENAATPEADIQAILEVIGRRSEYHRTDIEVEYGIIELNNTDLQGANLRGAHLYGAHLQGANLRGASLPRSNLDGAILQGAALQEAALQEATLQGADLRTAALRGANLRGAILQGTTLYGADLERADLEGADLQRTTLQGANLQGADLRRTNLQGALLYGASFQGALLYGATLQGANLREADLQGANLRRADLREADLQGANLQGADLREADLQGAKLQEARGITEAQIEWTLGSNETQLPEDLNRPELWSKSYEEQVKIVREQFGGD